MLKPPRPPGASRPPEPINTTPSPSLGLALEAAQAALDACLADGLKVGVAVTDAEGNLRVGLAADGTSAGRILFASRKALAAAAFRAPTSVFQDRLRANDPVALATLKPNMAVYPGGVPLLADGRLLGAIAATGATGQQDEKCAAQGAAKIQARLH
jgi:uncharacterized protein GlcG (DUF336 family)